MNRFMLLKQYVHRSASYISILQSGMLFFLLLLNFRDHGYISLSARYLIFFSVLLAIIVLFGVGYVDIKFFRGYQNENSLWFSMTPELVDMKNKVDEMYYFSSSRNMINKNGEIK